MFTNQIPDSTTVSRLLDAAVIVINIVVLVWIAIRTVSIYHKHDKLYTRLQILLRLGLLLAIVDVILFEASLLASGGDFSDLLCFPVIFLPVTLFAYMRWSGYYKKMAQKAGEQSDE